MQSALGNVDIIVLLLAVGSSIFIGLKVAGREQSLENYLLGGRDLPWWAILGSIVATETSTATVLSVPGHGFGNTGFLFLQLALGFILGRIIVVIFLLPQFFDGKLISAYEILGIRFGTTTKRIASVLFLVTRNLGDGLRLFLAAMVLEKLVGWPLACSAIAIGSVTILYTFLGGMRSVVWNDCIQFLIYMAGSITAVFVIIDQLPGGWAGFLEYANSSGKWKLIDPRFSLSDPFTLWAGLLGGAVLSMGSHGTDQMMVQRYLSARSQSDAAKAILWSGVIVFLQFSLFLFIGMLLGCFYQSNLLPEGTKPDQVFAHFIIHSFPANTGLVGLMLAAILAAVMSTLSSSLSASASSVVSDLWLSNLTKTPSQHSQFTVTRIATVFFGILQIGIGIWAGTFARSVVDNALTIAGFSTGILLGWFSLALLTQKRSQRAAIFGGAVGLAVLLFLQFGLPLLQFGLPRSKVTIAFPWLPVFGSLATLLSGLLLNALLPCDSRTSVSLPVDNCTDQFGPSNAPTTQSPEP